MSAGYNVGQAVGAEQARADLLDHRKIAEHYAKARLAVLDGRQGHDDYSQGYLDGYRETLTKAL